MLATCNRAGEYSRRNQTLVNALFKIQSSQGYYQILKETTIKGKASTSTLRKGHRVLIKTYNSGTSDTVGSWGSALLGSVVWTEI